MIRREGGILLPPPVALARAVDSLDDVPVADPVFEPKWDGWRAVVAGGRVWSRRGTDLTRFLPDLAPVLGARLPADVVIDGELVAWDAKTGRLDFPGLQARLTAGTRIGAVAKRCPVQLVCFDLLAAAGTDLRDQPLAARRARLEAVLSGVGPPLSLCQQTQDRQLAADWFITLAPSGVEGIVAKGAATRYRPGERGSWVKVKHRSQVDGIIGAVIGPVKRPEAIVVGRYTDEGVLRIVGRSTALTTRQANELAAVLTEVPGTGHPWPAEIGGGHFGGGKVAITHVDPVLVVEVAADTALQAGRHRHALRLLRVRTDLTPEDVDPAGGRV